MAKTMHDNYVAIMLMIITQIAIALYTQICFITHNSNNKDSTKQNKHTVKGKSKYYV